ncbi:MAG TPA: hypothetical protein VGH66_19980 [Acidimicrobiales bacterium]|jgi:hypothetical protein
MINPEAESKAIKARSIELVHMLDECVPTVDRTPIRDAQAEARRLAGEAKRARDAVVEKVRRGQDPGVPLGLKPPIRKVHTDGRGRDLDGVLLGRAVISKEIIRHWEFRRDVLAGAIISVHQDAAEKLPTAAPLLAAARGHLAELADRHSFKDEAGAELEAALKRFEDTRGILAEGINEGQHVADDAAAHLEGLAGEIAAAKMAERGVDTVSPFVAGRLAAAMGDVVDLIDASPRVNYGETAPTPVAGQPAAGATGGDVRNRSVSSYRSAKPPVPGPPPEVDWDLRAHSIPGVVYTR